MRLCNKNDNRNKMVPYVFMQIKSSIYAFMQKMIIYAYVKTISDVKNQDFISDQKVILKTLKIRNHFLDYATVPHFLSNFVLTTSNILFYIFNIPLLSLYSFHFYLTNYHLIFLICIFNFYLYHLLF
ncbi:hypothetical protein NBO_926g0002 [Nosema bombycis CQ1]|uniref:Uncharacterized protein n=1 Tax=Nosema bombycis (strain CQ1 / CVCC 102059) TaxID=578461 RepID=R0KNH6_NOSB1|nr:hypothetical protein NBO_926g0002 [Nosema bombycis CQ1]|eukprot:EOB11717.1 hypothetical protein NBO_926g0002 [Nosema bombycis CQ1]